LTGLPNRRGFDTYVGNRSGRRPFVILALDVDGLKQTNDTLGHDAGDELLMRVAQTVQRTMRRGDVLARLGGDEFAAYLFDADEGDGRRFAARMLEALTSTQRPVSVSIGIAAGAPDDDVYGVHAAADAAMYQAKRAGGRRYDVVSPSA
jgi:diguanylate cyclase (GGDEF)-like protein